MNRRYRVIALLPLLVLVLVLVLTLDWVTLLPVSNSPEAPASVSLPEPHYPLARHLRYRFTLTNPTSQVLRDVTFVTLAPVRQTPNQHCCSRLETSYPHRLSVDEQGNQWLHITFAKFPPLATRLVEVRVDLNLAETPQVLPVGDLTTHLAPAPFVESDDPAIVTAATPWQSASPRETARGLYDFVTGHLTYAGYLREDRGARYALSQGRGDCTEYMTLYMALARASGLPARGLAGFVTDRDSRLYAEDYHNWAEVYLDGVWLLVDAQKRAFAALAHHYIVMKRLNALDAGYAQRFWISHPDLQVRMD